MSDTLSIALTPGYLPADGELIDNSILRLLARPSVLLIGSIGPAAITDGAVTTVKLADGVLSADTTGRAKMADGFMTAAKLNATQDWSGKTISGNPAVTWAGTVNFSSATFTPPPGHQVQQVSTPDATSSTTTASIPVDDTVPQNTEGAELTGLQTTITPRSTTNLLVIEVAVPLACNTAGTIQTAALFQDSTAGALAAAVITTASLGGPQMLLFQHIMAAGTTSATTFKIRIGTSAGTVTINGQAGSRLFGGVLRARLTIREVQA